MIPRDSEEYILDCDASRTKEFTLINHYSIGSHSGRTSKYERYRFYLRSLLPRVSDSLVSSVS